MLTKLRIQNFKQFDDVEIELGPITVFAGPNNSGKTTALQALALWIYGAIEQEVQRYSMLSPVKTTAAFLHKDEFVGYSVSDTALLWRNRGVSSVDDHESGHIEIIIDGTVNCEGWSQALKFEYSDEEMIICIDENSAEWSLGFDYFPPSAFLSPMSGLPHTEQLILTDEIKLLIGEGRTSEVLRNLCYRLHTESSATGRWQALVRQMRALFGVELQPPAYAAERGELYMSYEDRYGYVFDLPSAGRGMLQTLLLLAYLYTYPGAVLLLDEPDAHLEIIRQRDIYHLLTDAAASQGSQIILATHSEVILREAFERKDTVIAFTGRPHRLTDIGNFVKSLSLIPAEDYVLADQSGWILYCEGETDALVLRAMAVRLQHPVLPYLQLVFSKDIDGNEPSEAKKHFTGLREAYPDLSGIAVFDRVSKGKLEDTPPGLRIVSWSRKEIENYFMQPATLAAYARASSKDEREAARREQIMREVVQGNTPPFALENHRDDFWSKTKASDEYLDRIFAQYSERAGVPLQLRKADYHLLVQYIPEDLIDPEVTEKLDAILEVARHAKSLEE
ncbi:MAG: AAA family ATPase [Anaerolineae bacterium]|nr:AAA family ATPase [Anaerolineae bacterium]